MSDPFATLRAGLDHGAPMFGSERTPRGVRIAGVLVALTDEPDPRVTLTERSGGLRRHAGQIAFPGGGMEPGDADVIAAALREAEEEVGLPSHLVTVLGTIPTAWVPASNYDVTAVVGTWDGSLELLPVDVREVASVVSCPVSRLIDPANRVNSRHTSGYLSPAFVVDDLFIWGFTGHLLDWTLQLAGWALPWDTTRVVDVPERFLRD